VADAIQTGIQDHRRRDFRCSHISCHLVASYVASPCGVQGAHLQVGHRLGRTASLGRGRGARHLHARQCNAQQHRSGLARLWTHSHNQDWLP
jgi:hypothetical protein